MYLSEHKGAAAKRNTTTMEFVDRSSEEAKKFEDPSSETFGYKVEAMLWGMNNLPSSNQKHNKHTTSVRIPSVCLSTNIAVV